jgi:ATP-dependent DNA helicase DinG
MHEAQSSLPEGHRDEARRHCGHAMETVQTVVDAVRQFFDTLAPPFYELPPYVDRIMLDECQPALGPGSETWRAAGELRETIQSLGEDIEALAEKLTDSEEAPPDMAELATDLRAQVGQLREFSEAIEFVLIAEAENFVYWLERTTRPRATFHSLHAAPLQTGSYIRDFFLNSKQCVVFTSATLQVDGQFDYALERIGAESLGSDRLQCVAVGSPFDYDAQSLIGVTTFLPDPGGRRDTAYDTELASFLVELLQRTRGRAMVLFTSYSLLNSVYEIIRDPLERAGIPVLAQGHGGGRETLTSMFRADPFSVLLGTRSFWEGVDIAGDTLSCLVLTKLPFHVFTDPVVRGRTDYLRSIGRDAFLHYTLPEAVISFRQGAGRLIRRRTDTGVVVVTDRRLVTKAYGRRFLNSVLTPHRVFRTREEALATVSGFFERRQPEPE